MILKWCEISYYSTFSINRFFVLNFFRIKKYINLRYNNHSNKPKYNNNKSYSNPLKFPR